jgi:hypothetical protein
VGVARDFVIDVALGFDATLVEVGDAELVTGGLETAEGVTCGKLIGRRARRLGVLGCGLGDGLDVCRERLGRCRDTLAVVLSAGVSLARFGVLEGSDLAACRLSDDSAALV